MKIIVKSSLDLNETELETQSTTLGALQILADGLDTKLKDGDKVEVIMFMFMLGGG